MNNLIKVLNQEDTVLFIGSGISMWSGNPSWSSMIEELALFVESVGADAKLVRLEAQNGDLLQAASYGFDKLTKQQIGEFIRAACLFGVAKPHDIHQKIVNLGPRCFITTNYDNLIEESLRKWQPNRFYPSPVTNRHLTETAEIVHARATDFIFKPHGDAGDTDSIILTREQYRLLLPQGERHSAMEALKMLMVSRPVVYLGFGLRDPDFLYIRDLLANTFKGGTRDHFAIMADVSEAEDDYWRRNYGIHLISYKTTERTDNTRDHGALLILLDSLLEETAAEDTSGGFNPQNPEVVLALARHAASYTQSPKLATEFQIRVHSNIEKQGGIFVHRSDKFDHNPVDKFLDDGPEHAILVGLPGAGKTYSLRRAASRLGEKLNELCLSEPFDVKSVIIPILVDLKLYRGNLGELVSQSLQKSLPFDKLMQYFKVKVFVDSFNEMPREYWENGSYESDFVKFRSLIGDSPLIISSRTTDGLKQLGYPEYSLDRIDAKDVSAELQRLGIEIGGPFEREVRSLMQRPFYFQYISRGTVVLPTNAHPRDFYHVFFQNLGKAFDNRFNKKFDIENSLSLSGYDSLNSGEEAFPLSFILITLKTSLEAVGIDDIDPREIANWLVSSSVLMPYSGGRVGFVHQSITEYLASAELARRYVSNPSILQEKLRLTRWDQALFLTLSQLPPMQADRFLQDVIKTDFTLALNAAKYLEVGRDEIVAKLLAGIPDRMSGYLVYDWKIQSAVRYGLPLTEFHEPQLRTLIGYGGSLGAAAVIRLVALKGEVVKQELLQMLVDCCNDYNFCTNGIGSALKPFATAEDAKQLAVWADTMQDGLTQDSEVDDTVGFTSGAAEVLSSLDLSIIRREFLPPEDSSEIPKFRAEIICGLLLNNRSTEALELAGELLIRGVNRVATSIYFIAEYALSDHELCWDSFTTAHVECLISMLDYEDETWDLPALKCICTARLDLAEVVKQCANELSGIKKAGLLSCLSPADFTPVYQALSDLIEMSDEERREQPIQTIRKFDLDWKGKEELFVQLLKLRDLELTKTICGDSIPPTLNELGTLDIGPIDWWLDWMLENSTTEGGYWVIHQLGGLFGRHLKPEVQNEFVAEFNKTDTEYRRILIDYILPNFSDITIELFNEDTISFLLADLNRQGSVTRYNNHLLGIIATEQFVIDRLLPLLPDAEETFFKNLNGVLRQAGERHGKRYVIGQLD